jgi:hypothetical protein
VRRASMMVTGKAEDDEEEEGADKPGNRASRAFSFQSNPLFDSYR